MCVEIHVCLIKQLITKKMKTKMKNTDHTGTTYTGPGLNITYIKYSKYKKCLSMMMFTCIDQHLSNIWSWIHEKVKQHWNWAEKKCCLQKTRISNMMFYI